MDALLDRGFKCDPTDANVEVGKFTVLIADGTDMASPSPGGSTISGTYGNGCRVPAGANDGPIVGVAQESIIPDSIADYSNGIYQIASGLAWPSNSIPSSNASRAINVRMAGISRVVAASAINIYDEVNIAAPVAGGTGVLPAGQTYGGLVKTVSEAAGTLLFILGYALERATQAGDVIRVMVMPYRRKA